MFSLARGDGCFLCVNICVGNSSTHLLESNSYITDLNTGLCCLIKHAAVCMKTSPFLSDMLCSIGRLLLCNSHPKPHFWDWRWALLCSHYVPVSVPMLTWPAVLSLLQSLAMAPSISPLKPVSSMWHRPPLPSLRSYLCEVGELPQNHVCTKMCCGNQGTRTPVPSSINNGNCWDPPAPQHCGPLGQSHLSPAPQFCHWFVVLRK